MLTALVLVLAVGVAEPAANKDDKKDDMGPKIAAVTIWTSASKKPETKVLRSAEEAAVAMGFTADKAKDAAAQKEVMAQLAKDFKVEKIDWQKQMIVVAAAGQKNTGGYSVEFIGLEVKDKVLTVKWKVKEPKPGDLVAQIITHPAAAALVERFDGEVKFATPADKANEKDK